MLAAEKTYQVTGPVVSVTDTVIVVDKDVREVRDRPQQGHEAVAGEPRVGAKVTVKYSMTAASIEVKDEKAPAKKK